MNRVVPADGQRVAVACSDPNFQLRIGNFNPGGDSRRAAVNRVESISVHVVRETAGAADSGDHDEVLLANAELREDGLYGGKDRIITTARTPTNFLVGLKVLFRK